MDPLHELFRHHAWATLTLIDHCIGLPPELLHQAVPGTYGPILNTLVHLVGADQRYLDGLTGEPPVSPIRQGELLPLADLRRRFEAQTHRWEAVLDRVEELDVTLPARGSWAETPHAQNLLLLQAIHHGNDHRTHICTALSVLGLEPPDIDGWSYWDVTHQSGV
jgi:uncharacterized damage-inducible protein DinB